MKVFLFSHYSQLRERVESVMERSERGGLLLFAVRPTLSVVTICITYIYCFFFVFSSEAQRHHWSTTKKRLQIIIRPCFFSRFITNSSSPRFVQSYHLFHGDLSFGFSVLQLSCLLFRDSSWGCQRSDIPFIFYPSVQCVLEFIRLAVIKLSVNLSFYAFQS